MKTKMQIHKMLIAPYLVVGFAVIVATLYSQGLIAHAASTMRYVATSGIDSGSCDSKSTPCRTIQYAIGQASSGDTVNVASGTYAEAITIDKSLILLGAQAGKDARVARGAETIIQQPAGQNTTIETTTDNVTIDGFTIDSINGAPTSRTSIGMFNATSNKDIVIKNNIIRGFNVSIHSTDGTDVSGISVTRNSFDGSNGGQAGSSVMFLNYDHGTGISFSNNLMYNNNPFGQGGGSVLNIGGKNGDSLSLNDVSIIGNVSDNQGGLLYFGYGMTNAEISQNVVTRTLYSALYLTKGVSNVLISHNFFNSQSADAYGGIRFLNYNLPFGAGPSHDITIDSNTMYGPGGFGVKADSTAVDGATLTITNNQFKYVTTDIVNNTGSAIVSSGNNFMPSSGAGDVSNQSALDSGDSVQLTTPVGTIITCNDRETNSHVLSGDSGYKYPLGLVNFCLTSGVTSNDVTLVFVTNLLPDQVIARKYNKDTNQYIDIPGAIITATTKDGKPALELKYTIVDNGPLDDDPTFGGIVDPVGLGVAIPPSSDNDGVLAPDTGVYVIMNNSFVLFAALASTLLLFVFVQYRRYRR